MSEAEKVAVDRQTLIDAGARGPAATVKAYLGLSGPGWLQSALTLGGGSLGSSLYLGVLGGVSLLWLQPLAMGLGVVMMSAIAYITLSTGERPFRAINKHINPVLGWSWLAATLMANMVWSLPQYSLCFAVCEQNFFPGLFMGDGVLAPGDEGSNLGKWIVSGVVLAICTVVTWGYGSGGRGVKIYDLVLKIVVGVIVLCFVGVVLRMASTGDGVDWGAVLGGLVPRFEQLYQPVETFRPLLDAIADPEARRYWTDLIVSEQRDVMLAAGAAAVGINMTFLLPYALLSRGWDKPFRGLTIFDLCTGTFIPFVLATGCIIVASADRFHTLPPSEFTVTEAGDVAPPPRYEKVFDRFFVERQAAADAGDYELGPAENSERRLAASLVRRDTFDLARSLATLFESNGLVTGALLGNLVFGVGVAGMTLSSISLMMLISGFVICEVLDRPPTGWTFRLGCLVSAVGVLWPLLWDGDARAWLTVIAGVYGAMLLPIAYVTFFVMMNHTRLLGDERPRGATRAVWNVLMLAAAVAASAAGVSAVYKKAGFVGLGFVAAYLALVVVVQVSRAAPADSPATAPPPADAA
ncbi:MAG: hypothetical protein AAFV43_07915 [Planctomycetota bacterium]